MRTDFEYYYEPFANWFQYHVYPLPDEGIIMYARDITETRKTEEALRKSEQLAAAGRLAASIAHEINNPLEAVTNLLYLASMDSSVTGNSRHLLQEADQGVAASFTYSCAKPQILPPAHCAGPFFA